MNRLIRTWLAIMYDKRKDEQDKPVEVGGVVIPPLLPHVIIITVFIVVYGLTPIKRELLHGDDGEELFFKWRPWTRAVSYLCQ